MKNLNLNFCICDVIGAALSRSARQLGASTPANRRRGVYETRRLPAELGATQSGSVAVIFFLVARASLKFRKIFVKMGLTVPVLPVKWRPRAILKLREVKRLDFEKFELKLLILRADVDTDWEDLDRSIWVNFVKIS